MKLPCRSPAIALVPFLVAPGGVDAVRAKENPMDKTIKLMSDLQSSIIKDGEDEEKAFREYYNWCDSAEEDSRNEIKTQKASKAKLTATIERASSDAEDADSKIAELAEAISTDERKLKEATMVRHTARADFETAENELVEAVDMLRRAGGILEKEMQGGASFAQGTAESENLQDVLLGLSSVVDAAGFLGEDDKRKLTALVESSMQDEDSDGTGAPAAAAYAGHSGGIVSAMEDMRDKAETQLKKERQEETKDKHQFDLLEQALKDSIADNQKNLANQKSGLSEASEVKATAEGKLAVVVKDLAASITRRSDLQHDCMEKAANHETTVIGRKEELACIAKAKKIIQETTGGAASQMYGDAASFLQMSSGSKVSLRLRTGSRVQAAGIKVVQMIQRLAKQQRSAKLGQLASRISVMMQYSSGGGSDPFEKVKGLISDMVAKLEGEASEEAQEKAYCDDELSKTETKKGELESESDGLKAKIDEDASASTELKEQVKNAQADLATLAELQNGMDKARQDAHAAYAKAKADLEQGLGGVRKAIQVLREYYVQDDAGASSLLQDSQPAAPETHRKVEGAGAGIIALLEVIESDLAKGLTEEEAEESAAADGYDTTTQDNKVTKASKEQAVKMMTQQFKSLDKVVSEHSGDLETVSTELSAVLDYHEKLKDRCIAKPEAYEDRKKRRDAEVKGLQEALSILEGETALMQRRGR